MKRRLIICSSLITIILSCFSFPIFAEETVQDSSTLHSLSDGVFLDQYFYDNYDPIPYLESNGSNWINTEINPSMDLKIHIKCSDFEFGNENQLSVFGSSSAGNNLYSTVVRSNDSVYLYYCAQNNSFSQININTPYTIYDFVYDRNDVYTNGTFRGSTEYEGTIVNDNPIYIFGVRNGSDPTRVYIPSKFKLYSFSIYDYSLNDNQGAYVRYYYPAKAKTSGTLGLYDAVSKTFFTSFSQVQFSNPTNEYVENFQISSFLTNSLTWIGQIFDAIIQMPIVIIFMAIGLAGAMFRWGRRIVHF